MVVDVLAYIQYCYLARYLSTIVTHPIIALGCDVFCCVESICLGLQYMALVKEAVQHEGYRAASWPDTLVSNSIKCVCMS